MAPWMTDVALAVSALAMAYLSRRAGRAVGFKAGLERGRSIGKLERCELCYKAGERYGYRKGVISARDNLAEMPHDPDT